MTKSNSVKNAKNELTPYERFKCVVPAVYHSPFVEKCEIEDITGRGDVGLIWAYPFPVEYILVCNLDEKGVSFYKKKGYKNPKYEIQVYSIDPEKLNPNNPKQAGNRKESRVGLYRELLSEQMVELLDNNPKIAVCYLYPANAPSIEINGEQMPGTSHEFKKLKPNPKVRNHLVDVDFKVEY
ncbi:hypothetical protein ACMXYX_17700 (plasmid) [Neptuniibacter sp. QD72_48]|uniref:hypothetical protein n=1 Tax=Neptuniibacter sp. QD72_48 TaxID=3398214 RepID=UPI0039F51716